MEVEPEVAPEAFDWISQVGTLFDTAGVLRLVCVDDRLVDGEGVRLALAAAIRSGELPLEEARLAFESSVERNTSSLDEEELASAVADSGLTTTPETLRGRIKVPEIADAETIAALRTLSERTSRGFELLDLAAWKDRRGDYLLAGTLVLFDKDMSLNQDGNDRTGVGLLVEALEENSDVKAALFTHSVEIGREFDEWKEIAQSYPDLSDRLLVISKHSLSGADHKAFALGLKLLITVPEIFKVIRQVRSMHAAITEMALDKLEGLSPYTLDRMFVGAIEEEGEWGPENFLSYVDALQRKELRRRLHSNDDINGAITRLRGLASMSLGMPTPSKTEYIDVLRQRKIDDAEYLNSVRLPLDLGDVFRLHPSGAQPSPLWQGDRYYILLLQRCDVALRAGGATPGARNFNPPHLMLYRLKKVSATAKPRRDTRLTYGVAYLVPNSDSAWEIVFGDRIAVPTMALDFCTLNANGESIFKVAEQYEQLDQGLSLAARKMVGMYRDRAESVLAKYDEMSSFSSEPSILHEVSASLLGSSEPWTPVKGRIDSTNRTISYGISRIARLRDPDVQDALDQLSAVQGRVALNAHLTID